MIKRPIYTVYMYVYIWAKVFGIKSKFLKRNITDTALSPEEKTPTKNKFLVK